MKEGEGEGEGEETDGMEARVFKREKGSKSVGLWPPG